MNSATRDLTKNVLEGHLTEVLSILAPLEPTKIALFGSFARGEAGPESDIDILIHYKHGVSIFKWMDLEDQLAGLLGRRVDLVAAKALKPRYYEMIEKDIRVVYDK